MACGHADRATVACQAEGCGRYAPGCADCRRCYGCLAKAATAAPRAVAARAAAEPALRPCPTCLVVRLQPGEGTCAPCRGAGPVSREGAVPVPEPDDDEPEREPMSGIRLG